MGAYEPELFETADEVFLTNSTWELRPVARLDGEPIGDVPAATDPGTTAIETASGESEAGSTTRRLRAAFADLVERRCY